MNGYCEQHALAASTPVVRHPSDEEARRLKRCYELAALAAGGGAAPVGAVLVAGDQTLGEAYELAVADDPFGHAELLVVRHAAMRHGRDRLRGATLYSNKEPCWMCSYAIRWARLARVVFCEPVDRVGGVTSSSPICLASGPDDWGPPPIAVMVASRGIEAEGR